MTEMFPHLMAVVRLVKLSRATLVKEIQAFVQLTAGMGRFQEEKPVMILIRQTSMVAQVLAKLS